MAKAQYQRWRNGCQCRKAGISRNLKAGVMAKIWNVAALAKAHHVAKSM